MPVYTITPCITNSLSAVLYSGAAQRGRQQSWEHPSSKHHEVKAREPLTSVLVYNPATPDEDTVEPAPGHAASGDSWE